MSATLRTLLERGPVAINVGLRGFAESLQEQDVPVVHIDWTPPPQHDEQTTALLDRLL